MAKRKRRVCTNKAENKGGKAAKRTVANSTGVVSVSTVTLRHSRALIRSVVDYPTVQLYDTSTNGKFVYHVSNSGNLKLTDPNRATVTPTLRQLEHIADDMVKTNVLELKWANGGSEFYDYDGVTRLREILTCKVVKDAMEKGNRFLFDCEIPESQSFQTPVSRGSLEVFWTMVDQDAPGERVTLNGKSIASASLCTLMSPEASVNEEVIDQISQILNENSKLYRTVVVGSKTIDENIPLLISRMKHLFGDSLVNVNILIYTNVSNEGYSLSEKQHHLLMHQHFVFGIYSLDEDKVLYVDTLAKPIPKFFMACFVKLSEVLGKEAIYFGSCHEEKASLGHSFCRDDCLYPYQSCAALGGIAVIIGMCIFTLDRQMFQIMTGQFTCEESAAKVSYLRDISIHSHFLRLVIINWIMNGVIELSQIYKEANIQRCYQGLQLKTRVSSRDLETGVGEELNHSTLTVKTEFRPSKSYSDLDHVIHNVGKAHNENISRALVCPVNKRFAGDKMAVDKTKASALKLGEASSGRCSILNINLKTKRKKFLSQGFDNASDLQHVTYVKTCDGQLSISLDEVSHLLQSYPGISFKKNECAYCIECTLATGVKRYKFFRCSPDKGKDDESVLKEIQNFFKIDKFLEWIDDDTNPKGKICDKTPRHNSPRSPAKNMKHEDDFDPEITIELNEGLNSSFQCKVQKTADNKAGTTNSTSRPTRSGKSPVAAREELPADNHKLPSPPKGDLPNGSKTHKISTANMIRVGCKHGRVPVYFGEVQHLLIGRPTIVFRKNKCYYSLECTFYNGITGYKNFRCNKARGRDDLDTLKLINEFLKVENFTPWVRENLKLKSKNKGKRDSKGKSLKKSKKIGSRALDGRKVLQPEGEDIVVIGNDNSSKVMEEDTVQICMEISDTGVVDKYVTSHPDNFESDVHNNPSTLSFERIKEFIVGKPKVHFRRAKNMYRVECLLWNGNKVHRNFPCTTSTKAETLEEIENFLRSDKAVNWVQNYDESWIFQYEVKAGIETRNCLDKIPFDITKHFIYDKKIVKPEYSKETCWVSVTENTKWGKTHRYDETYRIIGSTARYDPNTVIAYVYLNCASKTNECRSACGALLTSLTCQDNICDNCGASLDTGRECSHCKTTTSSQWYYKGEPRELCATCYTYRQRKGCDRPVEFKVKGSRNSRKIHHEHLQCQWRMKLEMKLNSLNTWSVYESSENINYHVSLPVQENKKPALGIRDMWDKLRVSRKATSLQIHTIESKSVTTAASKEEVSNQITHPLSQIKARCELVDKHHSGKRATDEHYQTILNVEHPTDKDESLFQAPQKEKQLHKKLQLESEANHTRICGICFEEGVNPPFTCSTKRELDAHKNKVHNSYGDLCAICYREIGMVVRFEDSRELMQHLNKHKVKYH